MTNQVRTRAVYFSFIKICESKLAYYITFDQIINFDADFDNFFVYID